MASPFPLHSNSGRTDGSTSVTAVSHSFLEGRRFPILAVSRSAAERVKNWAVTPSLRRVSQTSPSGLTRTSRSLVPDGHCLSRTGRHPDESIRKSSGSNTGAARSADSVPRMKSAASCGVRRPQEASTTASTAAATACARSFVAAYASYAAYPSHEARTLSNWARSAGAGSGRSFRAFMLGVGYWNAIQVSHMFSERAKNRSIPRREWPVFGCDSNL